MAQIGERSLDSAIAPISVLRGHADHQLLDLLSGVRTTWPSLLAAIIFPGDQSPMPAQQCCWRHDRGQFIKHAPAQFLGPDCQASALVIVKTEPLASKLFS